MVAILVDAILGLMLGVLGLGELEPLSTGELGSVVAAAMVCGLGPNDALKTVLLRRALRREPHSSAGLAG